MAVSGGDDWSNIVRPLQSVDKWLHHFFVLYVCFMVIGLLNIITGLFVDQAMQFASLGRSAKVRDKITHEKELAVELEKIFREGDEDKSGHLSWEEFKDMLSDDRVSAYLSTLDLDFSELRTLYKILDVHKAGRVAIDDFVWGCMRLQGLAKSMDLCTLLYEHRQHRKHVHDALHHFDKHLELISAAVGAPPLHSSPLECDLSKPLDNYNAQPTIHCQRDASASKASLRQVLSDEEDEDSEEERYLIHSH